MIDYAKIFRRFMSVMIIRLLPANRGLLLWKQASKI